MHQTLYLQFVDAVEKTPLNSCLSDGVATFNYQQILELVDTISKNLYQNGIKDKQVIALYADKSWQAVVCFLALSRLGVCCLTLDLAFPPSMIDLVIEDASVNAVIALKPLARAVDIPVLSWQTLSSVSSSKQSHNVETPIVEQDHLAWLVYSSGTTGKPKGIKIASCAMVGSILARAKFSPYSATDKVACNIYFYWEVFRPLLFGAMVYTVSDAILFDLSQYQRFIIEHDISETLWTPSFAEMLLKSLTGNQLLSLHKLKRVWLNGEVVSEYLSEQLLNKLANIDFYNLYSISETFDVAAKKIEHAAIESGFTSIGRALDKVFCVILDQKEQSCAANVQGELYLSSPYLCLGYLNQTAAEKKAFVSINNQRYFKTKDIAYKNIEGEIFIKGRNDHVVKLRGYNISLLSIESTLKKVLPIKQCVVYVDDNHSALQLLVAEIEPEQDKSFIEQYQIDLTTGLSKKLQTYLSAFLPNYALPNRFIVGQSFGVDAYSSKLNRKRVIEDKYSKLRAIWSSVLGIDKQYIKANSSLLDFGANSLQFIQLLSEIKKQYQVALDINVLLQNPSLVSLFKVLEHNNSVAEKLVIDIEQEIALDIERYKKIERQSIASKILPFFEASNIFVTGVTGFLGAHWLAESLKQNNATYYCLIRADNNQHAMERLKKVFLQYQLDISLLNARVKIICGSLTQPYFGLLKKDWQLLCRTIDAVFHAAAQVNLLFPYHELADSIISGTKEVLYLAITHHLKPMVLISSDAVYPNQTVTCSNDFLDKSTFGRLKYGYAQAKWLQEQLLKQVTGLSDLPFFVFRLGNLAPSLATGLANPDDLNQTIISLIYKQKVMSESLALEFTPVDCVVKGINQCLQKLSFNQIISINQYNVVQASDINRLFPEWSPQMISSKPWQHIMTEYSSVLASLDKQASLSKSKAYHIEPHPLLTRCVLNDEELKLSLKNLLEEVQYESMAK